MKQQIKRVEKNLKDALKLISEDNIEKDLLHDYIFDALKAVENLNLDAVNVSEIRAKREEYLLEEVWCCDKEDLGKVELFDLKEKVDSEMELIQWLHSR